MAGMFGGTIMLGQGATPTALTSPLQSAFIARFDPAGALTWSDQINFDQGTYFTLARLLVAPSGAAPPAGELGRRYRQLLARKTRSTPRVRQWVVLSRELRCLTVDSVGSARHTAPRPSLEWGRRMRH